MSETTSKSYTWLTVRLAHLLSFRIDKRFIPVILILLVLSAVVMVMSVSYGEYRIAPLDVLKAVFGLETGNDDHRLVVRLFRLPRIVLALLVGAALATSGAVLQGITRNALADPGILGINNGAALTAVALLVYFKDFTLDLKLWNWEIHFNNVTLLPWAAFAGALLTALLIYIFAWQGGSSPMRLILIGIGFAAFASALTTLMVVFGDIYDVQQAFVWLSGSVYGRGWVQVKMMAWWLLVLLPIVFLSSRSLNTLALGDNSATSLGLHVEIQRGFLVFLSVALAAGAVAAAGTIGFVGLVAPHITRRLVGANHEGLLPATALLGGLMVMLADFIGRIVIAPSQLPAGIVTAVIGAPYFMYLLWRYRDGR